MKMKKLKILITLGILLFILIYSCNKNTGINTDEKMVVYRVNTTEPTNHEPDYDYLGKSLYEFAKNYQSYLKPEEFFLDPNLQEDFRSKFDSLIDEYKDNSYEEVLLDFVSKGYISEELKDYKLSLYSDLDAGVDDVESYLDNKFNDIDNYNLSPNEKYDFKTEVKGLKYSYIYISEIDDIPIDSALVYRGDPPGDCDIDWEEYVTTLRKYVLLGSGVGAAIGSVVPGVGTTIGAGVGAIVGLGAGLVVEWNNTDQAQRFCERCIPTGLSKEPSGDCDGSALFTPTAGSHAYKFEWDILHGTPHHAFTLPGEPLQIWQDDPEYEVLIEVTSYCHFDEDMDLQLKKEFGPYDIFEDQNKVPAGALFFDGIDYFKFSPSPTSSDNANTYSVSYTETYKLGGLAILYPDVYTIDGVVSSENAINITITGTDLTVTWKVDSQHWDEFYNGGAFGHTEGIVNVKVSNNCPGGDSKTFSLKSLLSQGHP